MRVPTFLYPSAKCFIMVKALGLVVREIFPVFSILSATTPVLSLLARMVWYLAVHCAWLFSKVEPLEGPPPI